MRRLGRWTLNALTVVVLAGCAAVVENGSKAESPYDRLVGEMSASAPAARSRAAWEALKAGGIDAFPALVAHLKDRAIAADSFQQATAGRTTVGEACLDLLQQQVEGRWPKSMRTFQILTAKNVGTWLDTHRGLTLAEMRCAASRESLAKAKAALAAEPSNDFLRRAVAYLRERNENIERLHGEVAD